MRGSCGTWTLLRAAMNGLMDSPAAKVAAAAGAAAALLWCCVGGQRHGSRPLVVAVCGVSCSGKSTIATRLAQELNSDPNATALCQDNSFDYGSFGTNNCPLKTVDPGRAEGGGTDPGRVWKDWESTDAILWPEFMAGVASAIDLAMGKTQPVVVVEGFLLLARPASAELYDAIVSIEITKDVAWERRKGRALSMAHLPPGTGENTNYEVRRILSMHLNPHFIPVSWEDSS